MDLDGQGNLTTALKLDRLNPKGELTLASAMLEGCDREQARSLVRQHSENLFVIPSALDLFTLPRKLSSVRGGAEHRLSWVLELIEDDFDHCLVDCRPALEVDTDNALTWATDVLIPVDVDEFSIEALELLLGQVHTLVTDARIAPLPGSRHQQDRPPVLRLPPEGLRRHTPAPAARGRRDPDAHRRGGGQEQGPDDRAVRTEVRRRAHVPRPGREGRLPPGDPQLMSSKKNDFEVSTGGVNALLTSLSDRFSGETADQKPSDGTTAQRWNGTTAAVPAQQESPKPSKYTLLLDQDDALTLDQLALTLRRRTGRPVDKSEILRALIRLAAADDQVAEHLARALDRRTTS
ncbi:ParA family protein [Streptomyces sp. NRRL WC-3618]|uniref:ParA family protein n=1 Tax=Streptomyces sp. NRRL WC-3618 TaxID=1519490 RepID=UPI00099CAC5F|nr:ParA family protein [Streptomyces sp. NRRL WC-3618]